MPGNEPAQPEKPQEAPPKKPQELPDNLPGGDHGAVANPEIEGTPQTDAGHAATQPPD
jgi:hypothetical protein